MYYSLLLYINIHGECCSVLEYRTNKDEIIKKKITTFLPLYKGSLNYEFSEN